jgi:hypothetical protein
VPDAFEPVDQGGDRGRAQVHGLAQSPGGQRRPAPGGVHDRDQRADVGAVEPVQVGESLAHCIQFDGQAAKEESKLLTVDVPTHWSPPQPLR